MKNLKVYLAIIIASLIWGFATPIGKIALNEMPVSLVLFLRYFGAFLIIGVILLFNKKKREYVEFNDFKFIAKAGFLVTVVNIGLFYLALSKTSATDASIIYSLVPIITIIIAALFFKHKPSEFDLSGVIIAFAGTFLIISQPYFNSSITKQSSISGLVLMFAAAITVSAYSFMAHKLPKNYNMLTVNFIFFFIGSLGMLPFAIYEVIHTNYKITSISMPAFLSVIYVTVFGTVIAYILWTYGLEKILPSEVNLFIFLQPTASIMLAIPLLGEQLSFITIIGVIVTCLGIFIASSDNDLQRRLKRHYHTRHN